MPGPGGLPDVKGKLSIDSSEAVAGYDAVLQKSKELRDEYNYLIGAGRDVWASFDVGTQKQITLAAAISRTYEQFANFSVSAREQARNLQDVTDAADRYITAQGRMRQEFEQLRAVSAAQARDMRQTQAEITAGAQAQQSVMNQLHVQAISNAAEQQALIVRTRAQIQEQAVFENRMLNIKIAAQKEYQAVQARATTQRMADEKALQADIERTIATTKRQEIAAQRLIATTERIAGIPGGTGRSSLESILGPILASRMTTTTPTPADTRGFADIFADAIAAKLIPSRGVSGGGLPPYTHVSPSGSTYVVPPEVTGGYGAYDPGATVGRATSNAINAIRDSNKTYSMDPLLIAGMASAAGAILSSPGMRSSIGDATVTAVTAVAAAGAAAAGAARTAGGGMAALGGYAAGAGADALISAAAAISRGGAYDMGRSAQTGAAVTGFLGRWAPVAHYVMMGVNEILSTVGPAAVAAGAAAAVGLEGAQTGYQRISAVNAVGQSLGPALGMTPGQFLGLGNTLQKAQTLADPAVWSLLGAAKTIATSGGAGAFTQMGTNTIDMIDRFAAKVTTAFTSGPESKQLAGLVSQGTNYLQQIGAIGGNVGLTFLHAATVLPGAGGDLLTTVQTATRGLADTTGWLSAHAAPLFGMGLAAEAGGRYGPALVGTAATWASAIPGQPLGTVARAATADDIAAGRIGISGRPVATVGETIAGTGAAGAAGGIGALDLAAAAAVTYGVVKTITARSPAEMAIGTQQGLVNQDNLTQAFGQIASNMNQFASGAGGPGALSMNAGIAQAFGNKSLPAFDKVKDLFQSLGHGLLGTPGVRTRGERTAPHCKMPLPR